ncbi:MAG: thioredoxin family protein [Chitinophagaceae bacterium]|nr:MAG: thioredoxin family protein [Chitinophagaceae bacterium]
MKKIAAIMMACSFVVSAVFAGDPIKIGSALPKADVKMADINGKMISLKDAARQKGLLVMFSCNTCPYVVKNQERTNAIAAYAEKMGLGVILLNSNEAYRGSEDSPEAMKAYAKEQHYKWSYVIDKDHEVADAFGANRTPEIFLFNEKLLLVYHGAIDDNPTDARAVSREHLKEAINELTNGKEVSVKESRSVGCTIKRKKS